MGGQQDKVGGQKNKVGGQQKQGGGSKKQGGGSKEQGGVKKTRWGVKKTRCPLLTFDKVHNPLCLPGKTTSERPKVLRTPQFFFSLLTLKCASRHNGVHFLNISTSKSAPNVGLFFFFAFSLANVLHATTACKFSSLIWPHGSTPVALASLLFDPPEPQIIGKTQCFATLLPFRAPGSSFF